MKIFISWSGVRSLGVATALKEWLPLVLQGAQPWLSSEDIRKGARWQSEIAAALQDAGAGILCLTQDNLDSNWLQFEAGAVSKALAGTTGLVCSYLIDVAHAEVELPLGMFQGTAATYEDTAKLLFSLNSAMSTPMPEERLTKLFVRFWPELAEAIDQARETAPPTSQRRSQQDMLEEVLTSIRALGRRLEQPQPSGEERMLNAFAESMRQAQSAANEQLTRSLKRHLDDVIGRVRTTEYDVTEAAEARLARAVLDVPLGDLLHITYNVPIEVIRKSVETAASLQGFFEIIAAEKGRPDLEIQFNLMLIERRDILAGELNELRSIFGVAALNPTSPPRRSDQLPSPKPKRRRTA